MKITWKKFIPLTVHKIYAAMGLSLVVLATLQPGQLQLLSCPLLRNLHLPCPSCGMTRSFTAFARLDIAIAFHYNPLGALLFLLILFLALYVLVLAPLLPKMPHLHLSHKENKSLPWIGALILISNWLYLISIRGEL